MAPAARTEDGGRREPSSAGGFSAGRRRVLAAGLAGLVGAGRAWAQAPFPSRPLTIMAPANPGGGTDQIARLMQSAIAVEGLSPRPMDVLNRGGAAGAIGLADLVSRYYGDPHIIMASGSSVISSTVTQNSALRLTSAEPIARLITDQLVVATPADSRFQNVEALLEEFRRDPAAITWCGGSAGGVDHILVGLIAEACGVAMSDVRYIAYAGSGAAAAALLGGQVTAGTGGFGEWLGLARDGGLRMLAAASPERFGDRQIPTLTEVGVNVEFHQWRGVFCPPGLEPEHLAWWRSLIERMRESRTWQDYVVRSGWEDGYLAGEDFRQLVNRDQDRYIQALARLDIVRSAGGSAAIGPYAIPAMIGVVTVAALGATVVEHLRNPDGAVVPAGSVDDDDDAGPVVPPSWRRFLVGATLSLAYIAALAVIGFLIATPLFLVALGRLMRSSRPVRDGLFGIGLTAGVWLLFTRLLYVSLP